MPLLELKIVPNDRPNADGEWVVMDVPEDRNPFDFVPKENYHVVYYRPLVTSGEPVIVPVTPPADPYIPMATVSEPVIVPVTFGNDVGFRLGTVEGSAVTWDDTQDGSRFIFKTETEARAFASNCATNIAGLTSNVESAGPLPGIRVEALNSEDKRYD